MIRTTFLRIAALVMLCAFGADAIAAVSLDVPGCGNLRNAYGPYDYRSASARTEKLPIVESLHFTEDVEALRAGITGTLIDELDYTLRAFPNHHRALQSMLRYTLNGGKFHSATIPSGDCYFARAAAFAPDDEVVRILYGNLLFKRRDLAGARTQYEEAVRIGEKSPEINYNAGLFYLEIGDLKRARELADIAYGAGYPLPGLKDKLERAEKAAAARSGTSAAPAASPKAEAKQEPK